MRKIVNEAVGGWPVEAVAVGCSGNLTIERILFEHNRFKIFSNDVSFFTTTLARYFAGEPHDFRLSSVFVELLEWMQPYLDEPASAAASVMLSTRLVTYLTVEGQVRDLPYHQRMYEGMRLQWEELHQVTVERLRAHPLRLAGYHCGDAVDWMDTVPADHAVLSFPPFWAKGYANLYKVLEAAFEWDAPDFPPMDDERRDLYLERLTDREYWLFGAMDKLDDYTPYLRGMASTTAHGIPIYVYANHVSPRVVVPVQKTEPVLTPRLMPGEPIGDDIRLAALTAGQFNALRSQYLNALISPAGAQLALAVLVDEKIVGVFALTSSNSMAGFPDPSYVYMMTDFAVAPTDYPRLSKLVLMAVLSKEAQRLAERSVNKRVRAVYTTAFSNNAVSMKYRGIFKLYSRSENKGDSPAPTRYKLNYRGEAGQWTLAEALALWKKKHAKKGKNAS